MRQKGNSKEFTITPFLKTCGPTWLTFAPPFRIFLCLCYIYIMSSIPSCTWWDEWGQVYILYLAMSLCTEKLIPQEQPSTRVGQKLLDEYPRVLNPGCSEAGTTRPPRDFSWESLHSSNLSLTGSYTVFLLFPSHSPTPLAILISAICPAWNNLKMFTELYRSWGFPLGCNQSPAVWTSWERIVSFIL